MSDTQRLRTEGGPIQTVERLCDEARPHIEQHIVDPAAAGVVMAMIRRLLANAALDGYQAGRRSREQST